MMPTIMAERDDDLASIVSGRLALLANSKLTGNIIVYFTVMSLLDENHFLTDEPSLIYGNLIHKVE